MGLGGVFCCVCVFCVCVGVCVFCVCCVGVWVCALAFKYACSVEVNLCLVICSLLLLFRESLSSVLLSLEHHLGEIATTSEKLQSSNDSVSQLDKQSEVLKEALSIPNHPLISMQDRSVRGGSNAQTKPF